jgi:hypothetical protein
MHTVNLFPDVNISNLSGLAMQIYFVIWEFESDEFSKEPMRISI